MDYKKKYEEAERLYRTANADQRYVLESLFPKLRESEDEKVRKELIDAIQGLWDNDALPMPLSVKRKDEWLAWLEKQGRQNDYDNNIITRNDEMLQAISIGLSDIKEDVGWSDFGGIPIEEIQEWLEKQGEQIDSDVKDYNSIYPNFAKPIDKVEPNFNVGDWVVWDNKISCYVDNVYQGKESLMYTIIDANNMTRGYGVKSFDNNAHLWTIADAKPGDVLSDGTTIFIFKDLLSDGSVMSYCDYDTDSGESDAFCPLSVNLMCSKITPATKEQRDTLFAKMHEAGYMWDSESRQLLSLKAEPCGEQRPVTININKEDNKWIESLILTFEDGYFEGFHQLKSYGVIDWLKSLKQRIGG